jgi:hypothetical protein
MSQADNKSERGSFRVKARGVFAFAVLGVFALPAQGQVFARPAFVTPDGEKKIGQYVWVWRSKTIAIGKNAEIEAPCPTDYVVLGGGFKTAANGSYYGLRTASSRPSETFDAWVVDTGGAGYEMVTVTVYAGCAPASK